jgi:hypothetical protein
VRGGRLALDKAVEAVEAGFGAGLGGTGNCRGCALGLFGDVGFGNLEGGVSMLWTYWEKEIEGLGYVKRGQVGLGSYEGEESR